MKRFYHQLYLLERIWSIVFARTNMVVRAANSKRWYRLEMWFLGELRISAKLVTIFLKCVFTQNFETEYIGVT